MHTTTSIKIDGFPHFANSWNARGRARLNSFLYSWPFFLQFWMTSFARYSNVSFLLVVARWKQYWSRTCMDHRCTWVRCSSYRHAPRCTSLNHNPTIVLACFRCCTSHWEIPWILCNVEVRSFSFRSSPLTEKDLAAILTVMSVNSVSNITFKFTMNSFLYFAFGSNLNLERLRVNCCSAELVSTAKLVDYALVFLDYGNRSWWRGATASIQKHVGEVTWGAVWRISNEHRPYLHEQERGYEKVEVEVVSDSGKKLKCVTYVVTVDLPRGSPSPYYLGVIQNGAEELGLPLEYRRHLQQIQHNGCTELLTGFPPPVRLE